MVQYSLFMEVQGNRFKVIAKPNSKENKVICFDKEKCAYRISIKAKAEDNNANIEIIKFMSTLLKKKVRIISGLKSREKIIQIINQTNKYLK